jgi:hypothetical protein
MYLLICKTNTVSNNVLCKMSFVFPAKYNHINLTVEF